MAARPAPAGETLASSQWSPRGSQSSNASFGDTTSSGRTTPSKPTECLQTNIEADIKTITAYLVKERALEAVQEALGRINDASQTKGLRTVDDVLRKAEAVRSS